MSEPRKYSVLMTIEVDDEIIESIKGEPMSDEGYIESELGWAGQSFNDYHILEVKRI